MPANADTEIATIFARLKEEVRTQPAIPAGRAGPARAPRTGLPARFRAEQTWAVTAERSFENPPGRRGVVRGYVAGPVKALLRKLMRWYVEPVAAHQRSFNLAILTLVDELAHQTLVEIEDLERRLEALEQRLAADDSDTNG